MQRGDGVVERFDQRANPSHELSLGCAAARLRRSPTGPSASSGPVPPCQLRAAVVAVGAQPERERSPVRLRHGGATNDGDGHRCSPARRWRSGEHADPPRMDLHHRGVQLRRQVPPGQVDVLQRGVGAAMPGERGDRVQLPAHPGQIRQAQMPRGMGGEPGKVGRQRDSPHHLRPRPQRERVRRGCGATPTGTNRPGPGSASPGAPGTSPAAHPWAPSTAPSAPGGSSWSPHAPATCGAPGRDRRCAARTAPPGATPRHRPARASPGCGSAPRRPRRTGAASRPHWGSTAASPSAAPAHRPDHQTLDPAYNGPGQQDCDSRTPSSTRKS